VPEYPPTTFSSNGADHAAYIERLSKEGRKEGYPGRKEGSLRKEGCQGRKEGRKIVMDGWIDGCRKNGKDGWMEGWKDAGRKGIHTVS
jgi:hypothetical protein